MLGAVGGLLLLALVVSLGIGLIAAIGWLLFVVVLPIGIIIAVGYFLYQAAKSHLARQGRDISEFLPKLPGWADLPADAREFVSIASPFLAGGFGLLLPSLLVWGEATATIMVMLTLLVFSWGVPLAIYKTLNAPSLRNGLRFPLLAFLVAFAVGLAGRIHPLVLLFLLALGGGYGWWWYEHHPYLRMRAVHQRCKDLHAAAALLSAEDFLANFRAQYLATWGFPPSPITLETAEILYRADAVREIPPLPDMPDFQPAYTPEQDITAQLAQLETTLRELPAKKDELVGSITAALDAYTRAVPRPKEASVFTVPAWEMADDLPALVQTLGTAFAPGHYSRTAYDRNRDRISRQGLAVRAYETGERIEPQAFSNA